MNINSCPNCNASEFVKAGIISKRQRFRCKKCNYFFTVNKAGKQIDEYFVNKALQLYLEGLTYREIERILGVSHVSIMNWVRKFNIKRPNYQNYFPTYKICKHHELVEYLQKPENLQNSGFIITEVGEKFMVIKWEKFKKTV